MIQMFIKLQNLSTNLTNLYHLP